MFVSCFYFFYFYVFIYLVSIFFFKKILVFLICSIMKICEVDLFFPLEFWGKQNQTKAPKSPYLQNSFLEIAKKKQSRIL
jgi:hypothetical protein